VGGSRVVVGVDMWVCGLDMWVAMVDYRAVGSISRLKAGDMY